MIEISETLRRWHADGEPYAVATVVSVTGSAPRPPGAALAVDADGNVVGSVSGGCIEGAVYEQCREALADGLPVLMSFGYSDEDAFAVGLTCGGEIEVFIQPFLAPDAAVESALASMAAGEPVAVARVVKGPAGMVGRTLTIGPREADVLWGPPGGSVALDGDPWTSVGSLGDADVDRIATRRARGMAAAGTTGAFHIGGASAGGAVGAGRADGEGGTGRAEGADGTAVEGGEGCGEPVTVFVETYVSPPRMIVFGAIDFAAALVRVGKFLGYRVTVCDARPVFATARRFPEADEVVVAWPHRYLEETAVDGRTVVAVLTHDAKFDVPLLVKALRMPIAYVGAMGSRRTCAERADRLRAEGLSETEVGRLHAPIGLDLGARTPEETAVAIAAEIVAARGGGSGKPLGAVTTAIHEPAKSDPARNISRTRATGSDGDGGSAPPALVATNPPSPHEAASPSS